MSVSTSPLAFEDCFAVMMAALEDPKGVRVKMVGHDAATHFRMRCHQARVLERKANAETYEKPDPRHGVSQYDKLKLLIREDDEGVWVIFEQNNVIPGEVVSLSTGTQLELDMPQLSPPPKQIEAPRERAPTDDELGDAFEDMPAVDGEISGLISGSKEVLPENFPGLVPKPAIRRV